MPPLSSEGPDEGVVHSIDVVLVLHGGGSLGAFECGAYRVIAEWLRTTDSRLVAVAGASIGAINAGVIARNWNNGDAGAGALERLWQELMVSPLPFFASPQAYWQRWNGLLTGLIAGNPRLYTPNHAGWNLLGAAVRFQMPFHRTQSMESTIERHVGNFPVADPGLPLLLIRAMNVETGAAEIFHSARNVITPRHLRASAAIPLLFDPIEIDGQWYWDGDMGPRSLMADALAAIEDDRLLEGTGPLLIIVVDTMPRAGRRPLTELESSYRLEGLVFGGRSDSDQRWVELANHHLRFVEELEKHAAGLPHESPVRGPSSGSALRFAELESDRLRCCGSIERNSSTTTSRGALIILRIGSTASSCRVWNLRKQHFLARRSQRARWIIRRARLYEGFRGRRSPLTVRPVLPRAAHGA